MVRWDEGDIRRNRAFLGGNGPEMGQEVRLFVVVDGALFTTLARTMGGFAGGCRSRVRVVGLKSAVYENNNFVENDI